MTARTLAPWYAPATRRLALLRVGLPTLLACVFAMGSALAIGTPAEAAHGTAALVLHTTQAAISALDGGRGADGGHHHD